ncbi:hypothetical protein DFP98_12489 [Cohnella phaseoli]|uniref:Uncharacterized protein n=1 Tax=Cohnella phaseoli TaxID=456490 RepID=A0A3D9IT41_9BACL|nr:hypothetical protein DFP98_12489 [Cohnella phaseoli]
MSHLFCIRAKVKENLLEECKADSFREATDKEDVNL